VIVAALVVGLLAGLLGGFIGQKLAGTTSGAPGTARSSSSGTTGSCDAVSIANSVLPTIVTIQVQNGDAGGVGSGEIVRSDGYIVTNNHVISPAATGGSITVVFSSGEQVAATLVGRDPKTDLAVLKVSSSDKLPTIGIGNSAKVVVGEPVVALGAPLGLSSSVTAGIVSALGRNVPVPSDNGTNALLAGAIQTDASINPGNSGGALVDCAGNLIGINTAIATVPNASGEAGGGSVGIGFAVPVDQAMAITKELIANGKVAYPYFGVSVAPIPPAVARKFNVTDGLYVQSVTPGGPSAQAGLQPGDVITSVDGHAATSPETLTAITLTKKVGDTVDVKYLRDGSSKTTTVTLGAAP
jgi:putative serine protease PepD